MERLSLPPWFEQALAELLKKAEIDGALLERRRIREVLRKGGVSSDCIYQDEIDKLLGYG